MIPITAKAKNDFLITTPPSVDSSDDLYLSTSRLNVKQNVCPTDAWPGT
jgi:hypothetical protein